jgi:hypothetical protein
MTSDDYKNINFKINHAINFAELADKFSGNNKYQTFLSILKNELSCYSYGFRYYNYGGDDLSKTSKRISEQLLFTLFSDNHDSINTDTVAQQETLNLVKSMNIDHPLTKVLHQFSLLTTLQYKSISDDVINGYYFDFISDDFNVGTLFINEHYEFSIQNLSDEDAENISNFYKKFPKLYNGDPLKIKEIITADNELPNKIKSNFLKEFFLRHSSSIVDVIGLDYLNLNMDIMKFIKHDKSFNDSIVGYIEIKNSSGRYSDEHSHGYEFEEVVGQLNILSVLKSIQVLFKKNPEIFYSKVIEKKNPIIIEKPVVDKVEIVKDLLPDVSISSNSISAIEHLESEINFN